MTREELNNWFRDYCETSGATCVRLGFKLVDTVYYIDLIELLPEMVKIDYESSKNGRKPKLRLQLNNQIRVDLVEKFKAVEVGSYKEIFGNCKNDGDRWEQYWCEKNGLTWVKNSIAYYIKGDINEEGKEIQIKWQNASLTQLDTIKRAKAKKA